MSSNSSKTKFIVAAVVICLGLVFFLRHQKEVSQRALKDAERAEAEQSVRSALLRMTDRHHAIADWKETLSQGDRFRSSLVGISELEVLWQSDHPILFIGAVEDISSTGLEESVFTVEESIYNLRYLFATRFRLSITAPRNVMDAFLADNPRLFSDYGFRNGVAVVVVVSGITSASELDSEGDVVDVMTGHGKLLEILYTGDVPF